MKMKRTMMKRTIWVGIALVAADPMYRSMHRQPLRCQKEEEEEFAPPPRKVPLKMRKATTRLSTMDKIIVAYEQRLRETATLEKVFKYFSSLVVNGREMMTPLDLVRAITPGVPPSPMAKPINIPMFESTPEQVKSHLSQEECPEFFKFKSEEDPGLISFGRFLILVAILSIPSEQVGVVYHMNTGQFFKDPALRGSGMGANNLDFILSKHLRTRSEGYNRSTHSKLSIHRHLFGPDLNGTLSVEEFKKLHSDLQTEDLKLEYMILSDLSSGEMTLAGFARSVVARVPSAYRELIGKKAEEVERHALASTVVTFEAYSAWKEVLKNLENMERMVKLYSQLDGHFSPSNFRRSAKAVAGVELTQEQVWVLFQLFDLNQDEVLQHDEFVKLLTSHSSSNLLFSQLQHEVPEGLGLGVLYECCRDCVSSWFDGTEHSKK